MGALASLFTKKYTPMIGVDISSSAVKLLELSKKDNHYRIESFATELLPPGAINDHQIADADAVTQALIKALKRSGTRTRDAVVAVSGSSVITKVIQMPADLNEVELEEQLKLEADQYVPYPIEEVNLDFEVIGPTEGATDSVDVLLAACRTETIDERILAMDKAGLRAGVVDIEYYALENACDLLRPQMPNAGEAATVAIADIGASNMAFLVMHDGKPIYRREQAFGGKQLTEDIMRHYGMSQDEANNAKKFGGLPEDYESEVLPYFIDDMAQQLDRSLQLFFANSPKFSSIDQIMLTGGCAAIPQLDSLISEKLGVNVNVGLPFDKMEVTRKARPKQFEQESSALLVACGLAMRAFD